MDHAFLISGIEARGPELVANSGNPFVNTNNWSATSLSPTLSVVAGKLRMTATIDGTPRATSDAMTFVSGQQYQVQWTGNTGNFRFGTSNTGASAGSVIDSTAASGDQIVTATAATMYCAIAKTLTIGQFSEVGFASIRKVL